MSDERRMMNDESTLWSPVIGHASCNTNGHCVTCSDEALPAKVLHVEQAMGLALVMLHDTTTEVDISLVDEVAPDDLLLVHGGVAIAKL
jgi:hypothetical protein